MALRPGTIFKWIDPDIEDERCEDGQCIGIVLSMDRTDIPGERNIMVRFWEMCDKHEQIDPDGDGPYNVDNLYEIGQITRTDLERITR